MVRGPGGKEVDEARASCVVVASAAMLRRLRPLLLACAALLVVQPAVAKDSVQVLANRLQRAEDFRVRTQAALALGASNSDKALVPLCKALADVSTTVRAASATALGRLRRGGKACLERRRSAERSAAVKASIDKALQQLGGDDAEPAIDGGTKVYLAIGKTTDKTGRDGVKIDRLVRTAMTGAARSLDGYVIAPASESKEQATKRLGAHKHVRAFYLLPKVQAPSYDGGNLVVRVEVAIFTYPGKALKGSIPVKLTQQGVSGTDEASEDELIKMAAERALEKFAQNVERID